ncbi:glucohydrolase, partial [Bifidobacteriaceae bacterium WP022]
DDSAETAAESAANSAKSNAESTERMLVMINMTDSTVPIPTQSAQLLQNRASNAFVGREVMVTTYDVNHALTSLKNGTLAPWEGIAVTLQ